MNVSLNRFLYCRLDHAPDALKPFIFNICEVQMEVTGVALNGSSINMSEANWDDWKINETNITTEQMVLVLFPLSNLSHHNYSEAVQNSSSNGSMAFQVWRANLYRTVVPVMLAFCVVTIVFNLSILLSMKWLKKRSTSPTLCFSVSLAVADAYSSLVIGLGLLINSLLPFGYGGYINSILIIITFIHGSLVLRPFHMWLKTSILMMMIQN